MNITRWAINNKNTVLIFSFFVILGGISAYFGMGKLRNPNFTIQTAVVLTEYPGASPRQVELLVTEPLEKAVQKMGTLKHVRSMSQPGLSTVFVDIKDSLPPEAMPQIWNDLRERISDAQAYLPPGAGPSEVVDHFGRTYGVFLALTGEGFSLDELRRHAEYMQKRLKLCEDVSGVLVFGIQDQVVEIGLSRERMARLGVNPNSIYQALAAQNLVTDLGSLNSGGHQVRVAPTGNLTSLEDIRKLVVGGKAEGGLVLLGDIADVKKQTVEPPEVLFRYNGKPALGIGVSTIEHGNTVLMGESVEKKIRELTESLPAGLEVSVINLQSRFVMKTIKTFLLSLAQAVAIVLFVLFVSLGLRSALVITNGLIINITGTFLVMYWLGIDLQCISISSLIIVLGMLVDDSVVVTDNVMVRLRDGKLSSSEACVSAARATGWPQLIATFIAIASFLPDDLAKSSTGEFCKSLFDVVAIALAISWVQAMTVVPVVSSWVLKPRKRDEGKVPYTTRFYKIYLSILKPALRHRWITIGATVVLFSLSLYGFEFVKVIFFGDASRPQYLVDYWLPEGTRIEKTSADMAIIEKDILSWPEIKSVAATVGSGPPRFVLSFTPEQPNTSYGSLIVNVKNADEVKKLAERTHRYLVENFPQANTRVGMFSVGGAPMYSLAARISGDDPVVLRRLARETSEIMRNHPMTRNVCSNWRQQTPVWEPEYSQAAGAMRGITRQDLSGTMQWLTQGAWLGNLREGDRLLPIMMRAPRDERHDTKDIENMPLWGQQSQESVPMGAVIEPGSVSMENRIICRYDRIPTITVQCNPTDAITSTKLREELAEKLKVLEFPPGYTLEWGGLYEMMQESNESVYVQLPLSFALMIGAVILLFNGFRGPLIILLTLPLSVVGIVVGILLTGKEFGFMATLGMYGLIGMMIRNAVILIGEMDLLTKDTDDPFGAVVKASLTRVRPVLITACTTTFGMLPLYNDEMFGGMAVTIMGGLMFATLITLVLIPVLYATLYRIHPNSKAGGA